MSDQSDALKATLREKGLRLSDPPAPPLPGLEMNGDRPDLPMVPLPRGGHVLRDFGKNIGAIVSKNGVFRREDVPVTINRESGRIEDMDTVRFQSYVEDQAFCFVERFGRAGATKERSTMTVGESAGCLRADSFRYQQRKIQRVNQVRLPVIRKDGLLELLPEDYDPETEIYTMRSGIEYDESMTLEQAKMFLETFLEEFPFENERSLAVHITAMLAMFGPSLQPLAAKRLNFVYRSNMPRSGKGLLAQSAIVAPCGPAAIQSIPDSREEFKKILDTEALNGSSYIFFDEIERRLANRTLNSFLTTNVWTGRLMNSQKKFSVPQNSIVFMTGNNIDLTTDLAGRCLLVDLYVPEADVQSRHVEKPIDELYLARQDVRRDILSALWAIVRAWDQAKPVARPSASSVFRGFETFSRIFGGIVEFAGFGNPMKSSAAEIDPDYADMRAVVEQLSRGVSVRAEYEFPEIIEVCRELNAFEWYIEGKVVKVDGEERFELTQGKKSVVGKLFSEQYGGTVFSLADGRMVRFGKRGKNRQRRYMIEVLSQGEATP